MGVAEHHELGAGVDVVPFDEGQVHSSDSLQTREVWTPLPFLGVVLHNLPPETGLLTAGRTDKWVQSQGQGEKKTSKGSPPIYWSLKYLLIKSINKHFVGKQWIWPDFCSGSIHVVNTHTCTSLLHILHPQSQNYMMTKVQFQYANGIKTDIKKTISFPNVRRLVHKVKLFSCHQYKT